MNIPTLGQFGGHQYESKVSWGICLFIRYFRRYRGMPASHRCRGADTAR